MPLNGWMIDEVHWMMLG